MKSLVFFAVLIVFASCSLKTCLKQVEIFAVDIKTFKQHYDNAELGKLIKDAFKLKKDATLLVEECQQQSEEELQASSIADCVKAVEALVKSLKALQADFTLVNLIKALPQLIKEVETVQSECPTPGEKIEMIQSIQVQGVSECIQDLTEVAKDVKELFDQYQSGELELGQFFTGISKLITDVQTSIAECKNSQFSPKVTFLQNQLKLSVNPQQCIVSLIYLKGDVMSIYEKISSQKYTEGELISSMEQIATLLQKVISACFQQKLCNNQDSFILLVKNAELKRNFKECFNEAVKFAKQIKTLQQDVSEGTKQVDELIDEIDLTVKEVDKVLVGCEINNTEQKWKSFMPDECIDGLGNLSKLANKTHEDFTAKNFVKLVKDLEKLDASFKHNKEVCPFL